MSGCPHSGAKVDIARGRRWIYVSDRRVHRWSAPLPFPFTVNLAQNTGTNAGTLGLVDVVINAKLGMHHSHVRRYKAHMHNRVSRVLARNGPLEPWRRCIKFR